MPWVAEEVVRFQGLVAKRLSASQIAKEMGLATSTLRQRARVMGVGFLGNTSEARGIRAVSRGRWTVERIARMRSLMATGATAGEAAKALGCTRSCVIGKCRREGIPLISGQLSGEHEAKCRSAKQRVERARKPAKPRMTHDAARSRKRPVAPPWADHAPFTGDPKPLMELSSASECRWVVNDPAEGDGDSALFCCAPNERLFGYCAQHSERAYRPERTRS